MTAKLKYQDYKKSFVGFIDLLGFSNKVSKISDGESFLEIASVLELLSTTAEMINQNNSLFEQFNVTAISDSLIVSVPSDSLSGIFTLMSVLHNLQYTLINGESRILLRGYIVEGEIYHRSGYVFGGGYMNAYKLEEACKGPPRIIVDPGALDVIAQLGEDGPRQTKLATKDFLAEDEYDGVTFINYLKPMPSRFLSYGEDFSNQRRELIKFVDECIDSLRYDLRVRTKYNWLRQYSLSVDFEM